MLLTMCGSVFVHTHIYKRDPSKYITRCTGVLAPWPYVGQQSHTRHHSCVTNACMRHHVYTTEPLLCSNHHRPCYVR